MGKNWEKSCSLATRAHKMFILSFLLEKPNYKNPRCFLNPFEHAKFVLILKCNTIPCSIVRPVMTCARCGKLCTVFSGIFSAIFHVSCVECKDVYEICLIISVKKTDLNSVIYILIYSRCTRCIICHIAHMPRQHFKMKFLWRYGRELCYTLVLIQTLYA